MSIGGPHEVLPSHGAASDEMRRCPWHADSEPSLHINWHATVFYCFGCGEGGSGHADRGSSLGQPAIIGAVGGAAGVGAVRCSRAV